MRSINLVIFLCLVIHSCSAQSDIKRDIIGENFNYSYTKEHTVLDNSIHFKTDSTLSYGGGRGQYSYSAFRQYKKINDSTYFVYHPNPKPNKYPITDTIMIRVMNDVKNDTIYWKNDKEFIFRERLFKLFEYQGIPLEDQ